MRVVDQAIRPLGMRHPVERVEAGIARERKIDVDVGVAELHLGEHVAPHVDAGATAEAEARLEIQRVRELRDAAERAELNRALALGECGSGKGEGQNRAECKL